MPPSEFESLGWLLSYLMIAIAVTVIVFLIFRQLVLWYFRLNQIADDIAVIANHYRALAREERLRHIQEVSQPSFPGRQSPNG